MSKPKLAMYWAASCGGCEIALVNINEKLLEADAALDFMFCPCLLDTKKKDIEALPDGDIAITFFNGAIRTGENAGMARLLRRKSKTLVAFGSCATEGCIPGLANFSTRSEQLRAIYQGGPSLDNPKGTIPSESTDVAEGTLTIPAYLDRVSTLAQTVDVDYFLPGCPPEPHQIWAVVEHVISGRPLPVKGSVLGAGRSSVCEGCARTKADKKVKRFYRNYEIIPDLERCLLEQGIVCMGIATRDGCGALCPNVNMPCIGCYGPPEGCEDQGARMIGALGAMVDIGDTKSVSEDEISRRISAAFESVPDWAGMLYKFSLPGSTLGGRRV